MRTEDEAILSFYKELNPINEKSQVYLVQHIETKKIFIRKTLSIYDKALYMNLQKLHVKGIPEIFHIIEDKNNLIIIEEYINGVTLDEYMSEAAHLTESAAVHIILQLCRILDSLHSSSPAIIHRDIKPENIIINSSKEVFLIDFNASKRFDPDKNKDTILMGTARYAAPEQFGFSQSDARTDIYALGNLLNMMLTGFTSKEQLCHGRLSAVISKCTVLDPSKRYQSVSQLSKALIRKIGKPSPLPPGFRTKQIWKMVISSIVYILIIWLSATMEIEDTTNTFVIHSYRVTGFLCLMTFVLIPCNYMNIHSRLPFTRSSNIVVKTVGIILWCLVMAIFFLTILAVIATLYTE